MIDINGITKSFGALRVLKGIDLHVDKGEIVSIVGPSGAGKTTLLQIIGTLDKPDSGSIVIAGQDVSGMKSKSLAKFRCTNIGFVFQFHQLLPEFTALENVMIPAFIAGMLRRDGRRIRSFPISPTRWPMPNRKQSATGLKIRRKCTCNFWSRMHGMQNRPRLRRIRRIPFTSSGRSCPS